MFFIAVLSILFKFQVKWDGVQTPTWVKYQNVEILCDLNEISESESSPARNSQPDELDDGISIYLSFYVERKSLFL